MGIHVRPNSPADRAGVKVGWTLMISASFPKLTATRNPNMYVRSFGSSLSLRTRTSMLGYLGGMRWILMLRGSRLSWHRRRKAHATVAVLGDLGMVGGACVFTPCMYVCVLQLLLFR